MEETKIAKGTGEEINRQIGEELVRLMHSFGNLFVHVSGEGKIDFRMEGMGSAWAGMIKTIISGDIGCMKPYKGFEVCALDQAIDYLINLELAPHMNLSTNEEWVVTPDVWQAFIMEIKDECTFIGKPKPKYLFELKSLDGETVIATVAIEPLCNEFVVGEFNAAKSAEFVGEIEDYDQPKIKSCFIRVNGDELEIELDKLIYYRHRKYQPRKGDYLLKDVESGYHFILPQEDYSIH